MSTSVSGELEHFAVADAAERARAELARRGTQERPGQRLAVIGLAVVLFGLIFVLRLAVNDPGALIANFYSVPIALLAVTFGVRAGLVGAAAAVVLTWMWSLINDVEVGLLGYTSRAGVAILVGVLVGYFAERLRADIARRQETERELALRADDLARSNQRLAQAVRRLDALATIARSAGTETDLRQALTRIVEQGRELLGGTELEVWVRDGHDLVPATATADGPPQRTVPLRHRDETLGELRVHGADPDAALLDAIQASAATAIATARSVAADRLRDAIAASERERSRWAWELHDQTLQGLVGLRVNLSSALGTADLGEAVERAVQDIRVETSNLQHLIAELRPAALDELGLGAALHGLCDRFASTSGVEVDRRIELPEGLATEAEVTVYRVVQEALTNVAKHAQAERVEVDVEAGAEDVCLRISDDGRGFDPQSGTPGFGLRGMRERLEAAGGRLELQTGPGGTRVSARVPREPGRLVVSDPSRRG